MNQNFPMNPTAVTNHYFRPACVGVEEAAQIFGWPPYFFPVLIRLGHLKPLGRPQHNARKWFATCELKRLGRDPVWLDKAIRLVEKHVQDSNQKQRGTPSQRCRAPLTAEAAALN